MVFFKAFLTKVFSFLFGLIGYALTFVIRYLPGMLEAAMVIGGVLKGPIFGVFSIGMLVPWVNSKGILVGFFIFQRYKTGILGPKMGSTEIWCETISMMVI